MSYKRKWTSREIYKISQALDSLERGGNSSFSIMDRLKRDLKNRNWNSIRIKMHRMREERGDSDFNWELEKPKRKNMHATKIGVKRKKKPRFVTQRKRGEEIIYIKD